MKHDVFISYSHVDSNIADAICNRLESSGIRCWYAPRNIQPGHEWAEEIITALEESKIMVLVFTDSSNGSTQVKREVSTAVSSGVTIIPFKCTESEPSGSMQYYLSTLHWLDALTESLDKSIARLNDECKRILGIPETSDNSGYVKAAPAEKHEEKKTKEVRLPLWAIIAAAAVIAAVILCAVLLPGKGGETITDNPEPVSAEEPTSDASGPLTDLIKEQVIPTKEGETLPDVVPTPAATQPPADIDDYHDDPDMDSPGAEFYLYEVSEFYTDVYEKGVCLQKYFGDAAEVIEIPKVVDGWPVTRIGDKCFEDMTTIKKVVLPETLENLGYRCLYGCTELTDIYFPDSLTSTDGWCLAHTGIKEFIAPPYFDYLGYGSFYSCENLTKVVLTPAVPSIGSDTFAFLGKNCTVTVPNPDIEVDIKAFREDSDITIIAPQSSYLNNYAKAMHLNFQSMD